MVKTNSQLTLLLDICLRILRKYNLKCDYLDLETIARGHYVFGVNTNNIDVIVDMNFELADMVSKLYELDSCKLIALFRPSNSENK